MRILAFWIEKACFIGGILENGEAAASLMVLGDFGGCLGRIKSFILTNFDVLIPRCLFVLGACQIFMVWNL